MLAVDSYGVVLALHIMAVLFAYGLPLAYPLLLPYVRRRNPRAMGGEIDVAPFVSHRITLDEVNHGFELMERQDGIRSVISF